ncbi:MAG TPA: hypothetical protein DF292_09115 [Firmicutes bacterium]|jgi:hypothetical protein|nr:hypothetical protein [Bacillota bacterium]
MQRVPKGIKMEAFRADELQMDTYQLKLKLRQLRAVDFAPLKNEKALFPLCLAMAPLIGSPDPELRDDLVLEAFYVIINNDLLTKAELRNLLDIIIDDHHLVCGLGESDTDTVFARTFSLLILSLLIEADCRLDFMGANTVLALRDLLIRQISQEQDLRGYVEGRGWAHSVAHSADAVHSLIAHRLISGNQGHLQNLLHVLLQKICTHKIAYLYNEDERTVIPVISAVENGLSEEQVTAELAMMVDAVRAAKNQLTLAEHWTLRTNVKNFLSSLYAHLRAHPYAHLQESTLTQLRNLTKRDTKMISYFA